MYEEQVKRVHDELKAVKINAVGLKTAEAKELARILHPDEHIGGAVFGRNGGGIAWLIATDSRIIYYDKKPLFTTNDEFTYDVVSGVKSSKAGPFCAVVLHTRIADYSLRYVPDACAAVFVAYIEKRRLESGTFDPATGRHTPAVAEIELPKLKGTSPEEGLGFLKGHDLAVLSTIDRTGNVHGAVVYYVFDSNNFIYILTKSDTTKGRNIYGHSQIALTVHETGTQQTVQVQGTAEVETNQTAKESVFNQIVKSRPYRGKMDMPPVTKLDAGAFMIIRINPTNINYHDYSKVE